MAYRDFKLIDLETKFGVTSNFVYLFDKTKIKKVLPSQLLLSNLEDAELVPLTTEKALSERVIAPVLAEIKRNNRDKIQLFSGEIINANSKEGLNGEIGFLFTRRPNAPEPQAPIISVTEAKIGRLDKAIPQAAAQMIGARVFNKNHNEPIETIYGTITDGNTWRFLKLEGNIIWIDNAKYSLAEMPILLGVFQEIVDFYFTTK
jgi:hypothetical protein